MNSPAGLATASTAAKNKKICNQPFIVMSEFLRTQERVQQIDHQQKADEQNENVFKVHWPFSLSRASHSGVRRQRWSATKAHTASTRPKGHAPCRNPYNEATAQAPAKPRTKIRPRGSRA